MKHVGLIPLSLLLFLIGGPAWSQTGNDAAMALLAPAPVVDARSDLAVAVRTTESMLDTFRIPRVRVTAPEDLRGFSTALIAGGFSNATLTPAWVDALYRYVEEGGILLAPSPVGSKLHTLFGVSAAEARRDRYRLRFTADDPILSYVDHPREREISLGNGEEQFYRQVIWSRGYEAASAAVLGRFDDGSAALTRNYFGRGISYLFGLAWEESVLLPRLGNDWEAQRDFVNAVEPSADVVLLMLRALYGSYAVPGAAIHPIPGGAPTALILSHDVDAQTSFLDSLKFAALEEEFGVTGTFFQNTKTFTNWMDIDYYNVPENRQAIRELFARGHEIGSHTVAHDPKLDERRVGSPDASLANYRPAREVTLSGEVRVSKQLLERDVPGLRVRSFRAGNLSFHSRLIGVLEDAGYRYDSSFSANDVLTTFPYFALRERSPRSPVSQVIEIPLTLDDSLGFLTPQTVGEAAARWISVFEANAANDSITVLLNHPSDTREEDHKLQAQRALMERAREMGAWMGSLTGFGDFWRARAAARVRLAQQNGRYVVTLLGVPDPAQSELALELYNLPEDAVLQLRDGEGRELAYREVARSGSVPARIILVGE